MKVNSFVAGMATGAAILVVGMALAGAAQAPGAKPGAKEAALPAEATFQVVNTGALNVTNKKGDIVAQVTAGEGGGSVMVYSDNLQLSAIIGVQSGGGALTICDKNRVERVRMNAEGVVEVLGSGNNEVLARMSAFKADGNAKAPTAKTDFSGQFSTYQKNGVLVDKLPK